MANLNSSKNAFAVAASLMLAACGGGSNDSSPAAASGLPPVQVASNLSVITSAQATPSAANAFSSVEALNDSASTSAGFVTGVSVSADSPAVATAAVGLLSLVQQNRSTGFVTGVSVSQSQACPGGGSITLNGNVASQDNLSAGDNITFAANSCVIQGIKIDGDFTLALNTLNGTVSTTTPWSANMAVNYRGLNVNSGTDTVVATGDMQIAYSQTDANHRTYNLSGSGLQIAISRSGIQLASRTLQGYSGSASIVVPTATQSVSYTLSGTSTALGVFNANVKTITPFMRTSGSFPTSGSLIVNGASSSVTLTALDATNVRIDYSEKGDGVITNSTMTTWLKLKAAI